MSEKQRLAKRTPATQAVRIITETLEESSSPMTIQDIVRKTNLNRRTVEKAVDLLKFVSTRMVNETLETSRAGRAEILEMREKAPPTQLGMLEFPLDLQRLIIKTIYYPTPSQEETVLVHLVLKDARDSSSAVELEASPTVSLLLEQESILKNRQGRFYLSNVGRMVAEGALSLYPELKELADSLKMPG